VGHATTWPLSSMRPAVKQVTHTQHVGCVRWERAGTAPSVPRRSVLAQRGQVAVIGSPQEAVPPFEEGRMPTP
jgi:hypothetical protein